MFLLHEGDLRQDIFLDRPSDGDFVKRQLSLYFFLQCPTIRMGLRGDAESYTCALSCCLAVLLLPASWFRAAPIYGGHGRPDEGVQNNPVLFA